MQNDYYYIDIYLLINVE